MVDFTFPPDVEDIRVREFMTTVVKPAEGDLVIERHDLMRIATNGSDAYTKTGSLAGVFGHLPV
jgi:hypothetical protein